MFTALDHSGEWKSLTVTISFVRFAEQDLMLIGRSIFT